MNTSIRADKTARDMLYLTRINGRWFEFSSHQSVTALSLFRGQIMAIYLEKR